MFRVVVGGLISDIQNGESYFIRFKSSCKVRVTLNVLCGVIPSVLPVKGCLEITVEENV
jgi:hypothetical protein